MASEEIINKNTLLRYSTSQGCEETSYGRAGRTQNKGLLWQYFFSYFNRGILSGGGECQGKKRPDLFNPAFLKQQIYLLVFPKSNPLINNNNIVAGLPDEAMIYCRLSFLPSDGEE